MQWIVLSLLSAVFLGLYDLAKKTAARDNAVPLVLLLNVCTAALICMPFLLLSSWQPTWLNGTPFLVEHASPATHGLLFGKSVLVGVSWTCALFALKHLPLSIAAPIRSTSPLWTTLIAVLFMGERPTALQWSGMLLIMLAFLFFSRVGKREGVHFRSNRWVGCMIAATLLGALSALFDKYLLQGLKLSPATVQAWFSIYLVAVMLPLGLHWFFRQRSNQPFEWRWTIPAIAITLLIADFLYFAAVSDPQALISIISPLRRTSVIIPFLFGILVLSEKSWQQKALCIALMLLGVVLVSYRAS